MRNVDMLYFKYIILFEYRWYIKIDRNYQYIYIYMYIYVYINNNLKCSRHLVVGFDCSAFIAKSYTIHYMTYFIIFFYIDGRIYSNGNVSPSLVWIITTF